MKALRLDINYMMKEFLGDNGIDCQEIRSMQPALCAARAWVEKNRGLGMQGWMTLPYNQGEVVEQIQKTAARIRDRFETFVTLGIGGSALGPAAVMQALNHLHYNELPREKRGAPKFYIEDNIDPERMQALFDVIDLKNTCFNVVSKSGGTAETMSQYLIIRDALKKAVGDAYRSHIIVTTSQNKGFLREIAQEEGYEMFYIPDGVGGRFSELCPVGLLAAAVTRIDIQGLLDGAKAMDERCASDDPFTNPALLEAALMTLAMQKGRNISVMLPYADSLKLMSDWYAQLWAESLGKNQRLDGTPCHTGSTPVKALGVTDQHSQLQLYTEGPFDKVITFLAVEQFRAETPIPHGCESVDTIAFLGGKSHSMLLDAERRGTEYALLRAGRMNQTIVLPEVSAETIGQLIYFLEMVTAYAGALLQIDTFNQPGVEESKLAAYAVLGFESEKHNQKRAEMNASPARKDVYIL